MKFFERRRRQAQLAILGALIGSGDLSTFQVVQATGLGPGRVHVALAALESAGRIRSRWADEPQPRRRLYRIAYASGGVVRSKIWVGA